MSSSEQNDLNGSPPSSRGIECDRRGVPASRQWRLHGGTYLHIPLETPLLAETPALSATARSGEVLLCPAGMVYRIAPEGSALADIITVRIRSRAFNPAASGDREICDLLWRLGRQANSDGPLVPGGSGARDSIRTAAVRLADESRRGRWGLAVRLKSRAMLLLAEIGQHATRHLEQSPSSRSDGQIREALWSLDEHFDEPVSATSLAGRVGLSRSHFHKAFREYTGRTFGEHLAALRVARACRLLEDPSADIAAIALECGYESLSQFYARFGHIMGVPPGRYRRRLRD